MGIIRRNEMMRKMEEEWWNIEHTVDQGDFEFVQCKMKNVQSMQFNF